MDDLDELTLALSAVVLEQVGPDEVPLLDAVGPELLQAAEAGPGKDGSLGFGGVETVLALVIITVSKQVLSFLADVAKDVAVEQGSGWAKRLLTALQRKRRGEALDVPVKLDAREVTRVREVAFTSAISLGVDEGRARLLADAMGGAFVFDAPGPAPAG